MFKLVKMYIIVKDENDVIDEMMKELISVIGCELCIDDGFDGLYNVLDFNEVDVVKKSKKVEDCYEIDDIR